MLKSVPRTQQAFASNVQKTEKLISPRGSCFTHLKLFARLRQQSTYLVCDFATRTTRGLAETSTRVGAARATPENDETKAMICVVKSGGRR